MKSTLILVRHGQSKWNLQNRFTGWVDVPLSEKGWAEAEKAGKLLESYTFDVAFTSHQIRAIATLTTIFRFNKGDKWPVFKHPEFPIVHEKEHFIELESGSSFPVFSNNVELAERNYGDLQGLNKDETREKFGEEQVHLWRRSFDIEPPNGESLKDTLDRVLPFFHTTIVPHITAGKTVIISAHGNSLRALSKFLENISDEAIPSYEIPTGVPIVYELETVNDNKIKVLKKTLLQ